jgi:hypothetical protein
VVMRVPRTADVDQCAGDVVGLVRYEAAGRGGALTKAY